MNNTTSVKTVGLVGARGYVGKELLELIHGHKGFEIAFASSRALEGKPIDGTDLKFQNLNPTAVAKKKTDVVVLALPNGLSAPFVEEIDKHNPNCLIVDLSGDHRFQDNWVYGLPETGTLNQQPQLNLNVASLGGRVRIKQAKRIANPGCYATAMQLALFPMLQEIGGDPACFGVSGYSGAGTSPSRKNDLMTLSGNIMPYALKGHMHEKEVSRQLGIELSFMPHVAQFFRGLSITANIPLNAPLTMTQVIARYSACYDKEPLIRLCFDEPPELQSAVGTPFANVGGFTLSEDGRTLVVVSVIDNLMKGAASQALQNMNLACGFLELSGLQAK
ncbi:MAG: N-acetyl-gamma-glutamyl-phosphate reductase [Sphingomonadales bacterium]|nr:N-acetyl-gamma-glutamyl-phosphate reductase [Sphingomonadales bacterium]